MASFAILDDNNIVTNTIKISNLEILDENGNESEELGIQKVKEVYGEDVKCVQFWYSNPESNLNPRFRPAVIQGLYDESKDIFVVRKNSEYQIWDEETKAWVLPPAPTVSGEGIAPKFNYETGEWETVARPKPLVDLEFVDPNLGKVVIDYTWNSQKLVWDPVTE